MNIVFGSIEDYATVESTCNGAPVYSFNNIIYIYGVSPHPLLGVVMQVEDSRNGEGNTNPKVKIKPKKSWEIKHNFCEVARNDALTGLTSSD